MALDRIRGEIMAEVKRRKKRKLKRYRIVWPWANNTNNAKKPKKRRRNKFRLKKEVYFALAGVILILGLIFVPRAVQSNNLKKLGYKKDEISEIRKQKLANTLLKNNYYSPYLASCIKDGTLNTDYLSLYTVISNEGSLTEKDFLLYNRLLDRGYEEVQILNLFKNLYYYEMTPLLVFDYQYDEKPYIDDCLSHRDTNSTSHFELTGDYYTEYGKPLPVDDPTNINMLVNKSYYLDSSYVPENITELSNYYGASGRSLAKVAADALAKWCDAGRSVGVVFYATSAYRPYEDQEKIYNNMVSSSGQASADALSARPGYSEHQTGLTVDIAATNEESKNFAETNAYLWTSTNSPTYGWILRYPQGKEQITGYDFEPWHYRYIGKALAEAVSESKLTYDEFYALYLKPWDNEENKPSNDILNATNYHANSHASPSPASTSPSETAKGE